MTEEEKYSVLDEDSVIKETGRCKILEYVRTKNTTPEDEARSRIDTADTVLWIGRSG